MYARGSLRLLHQLLTRRCCDLSKISMVVPVTNFGISRETYATSWLMLPTKLNHCYSSHRFATSTASNLHDTPVHGWLEGRVKHRSTAMLFEIALHNDVEDLSKWSIGRTSQGSHGSRIHRVDWAMRGAMREKANRAHGCLSQRIIARRTLTAAATIELRTL